MQPNNFKLAAQPRFAIRRVLAALALGLALTARADKHAAQSNGYLPATGPAPLRFLSVAVPPTNFFIPPPPPPVVPVAIKTNLATAAHPASTMNAASVVTEVSSQPATQPNDNNAPAEPINPDGVISPQMLLKFFNKSTNGVSASVIAPIDFSPPKPASVPPSKASFSTGP